MTNQEATVNTITDSTSGTNCSDSRTTIRTGSVAAGGTGGGIARSTGISDGNGGGSSSGTHGNSLSVAGGGAGGASRGIGGGSGTSTGGGVGSVASGGNGGEKAARGSASGCGGGDIGGDTIGGDTCSFEEDDFPCLVPEAAPPRAVWRGHRGSVARISSCSQPPCFFTLGEVIKASEYNWLGGLSGKQIDRLRASWMPLSEDLGYVKCVIECRPPLKPKRRSS